MTKIALVTGGSRGLGRNAALSVARRGNDVALTYQNRADAAQAVVGEIERLGRRAVALQLEVGQVAGFAAFAERLRSVLLETWGRPTSSAARSATPQSSTDFSPT